MCREDDVSGVNNSGDKGVEVMATKKRRTVPIKVAEPEVVPISDEDYQQAVTAFAKMISDWWQQRQREVSPDRTGRSDADQ
jgi:hypothetical protein